MNTIYPAGIISAADCGGLIANSYYFALAGVKNPLGIAQAAFAIQIVGNICSWPLIDRLGRRPMIVGGSFVMLCGLLVIGGISTLKNAASLKATVAFMTLWGFVVS